jgi:hypothetical protein
VSLLLAPTTLIVLGSWAAFLLFVVWVLWTTGPDEPEFLRHTERERSDPFEDLADEFRQWNETLSDIYALPESEAA